MGHGPKQNSEVLSLLDNIRFESLLSLVTKLIYRKLEKAKCLLLKQAAVILYIVFFFKNKMGVKAISQIVLRLTVYIYHLCQVQYSVLDGRHHLSTI